MKNYVALLAAVGAIGVSAVAVTAVGYAQQTAASPAAKTSADGLESLVETNVRTALSSLGAGAPGSQVRADRFRTLMTQFADVNAISTNVLGRYSGALRTDAALRRDWEAAFTDFAYATYEDQLDRFRGFSVRATRVTMNRPGQDALVRTEMTPAAGGRATIVQWRMLNRGSGWRVYDVLVNLRGNELWLGQRQKLQFEAQLDRSRGDIRALIGAVRQETTAIRARLAQGRR